MTNAEMVREFHAACGQPTREGPRLLTWGPNGEGKLRFSLMREELDEYSQAIVTGDIVEIADALGDLLYVVYGTALTHGLPIDEIFAEIHRSNMTKVSERPLRREDGKIMKGPDYAPPLLAPILMKAVEKARNREEAGE